MRFSLRAVVATAFVLGAASNVSAADVAAPVFKAPVAAPVPSWTGTYFGVNGGYAWQDRPVALSMNDAASINGISLVGLSIPHEIEGGFAGFQLGYNWQFNQRWLAGFEADFQFGNIEGGPSLPLVTSGAGVPGLVNYTEDLKWFGTVRGRLGFLPIESILLYGTGGLAYGRVNRSANYISGVADALGAAFHSYDCDALQACFTGSASQIQFGWTLGGGAEWTLWNNITFKAEYLYINLGDGSVTMSALRTLGGLFPSSMTVASGDTDFHILRGGLNARF
jgi:outer membrane immunogenic protein